MEKAKVKLRNWQKARLIGFNLDSSVLGDSEKARYNEILRLKESLLNDWDTNTEVLIGHPLPPYKCTWCGKRSNVAYEFDGKNYCAKDFKEINHE